MGEDSPHGTSSYDPAAYGEMVGDYDLLYPPGHLDTAAAVAAIAELAGPSGSILEFGIGTGRLALPLHAKGLHVAGIDVSPEMVEQLRAKPGGDEIEVGIGNFIDQRVSGTFSVVVLAANGIVDPPTRQAQIACFRNAASHLEPGGYFVVECYVLRPDQLTEDWTVWPRFVQHDHVELQLSRFDPVTHVLERTMVHLRADGTHFITVKDNYAWPGELDLIAHLTGFELTTRCSDWESEPFEGSSRKHVSTYRLVEAS